MSEEIDRRTNEMVREQTLERLQGYIDAGKQPGDEDIASMAKALDRHPKTVRRWLREKQLPQRAPWGPDEDSILDLYLARNVAADAHERMLARLGAENVPDLRTVQRGFAELPKRFRAYIERGERGFFENTLVITDPDGPLPRNRRWESDFIDLKLRALPRGHRHKLKAYLVVIIDAGTRVVMGWALVVGRRPNRSDVLMALYDAVCPNERCGPGYGIPIEFRCDNGLQFVADDVEGALDALGSAIVPTLPYTPWHKGRVERVQGTLKRKILAQLGGAIDGARDRRGKLYADDRRGHPVELLTEVVTEQVYAYNHRQHQSLGRKTPAQAWEDDPTPIRELEPRKAWLLCQAHGSGKVERQGIRFNNTWYVDENLVELHKGKKLEFRFNQNQRDAIEVLVDGEWFCTAVDIRTLDPDRNRAILEHRHAGLEEAGRLRAKAARKRTVQLAARTSAVPNPHEPQPDLTETLRNSLTKAKRPATKPVLHDADSLEATWRQALGQTG